MPLETATTECSKSSSSSRAFFRSSATVKDDLVYISLDVADEDLLGTAGSPGYLRAGLCQRGIPCDCANRGVFELCEESGSLCHGDIPASVEVVVVSSWRRNNDVPPRRVYKQLVYACVVYAVPRISASRLLLASVLLHRSRSIVQINALLILRRGQVYANDAGRSR